ncbi:MAG: hypothetical protein K8R92_01930 [Planctomycetes bacterium]|nr:hypothetical protein [Planctomycetota bacterium]
MQQNNPQSGDKKNDLNSGGVFGAGPENAGKPSPFAHGTPGGFNFHGKNATFGNSKGSKKGAGKRSGPISGGGQKRSGFGGARGR